MAGFEPILPKRKEVIPAASKGAALRRRMGTLGNDLWRKCADYEAPAPELYVRTNTLKRSWSKEGPRVTGGVLYVEVKSSGNIAPYNVWVRGKKGGSPGQAEKMGKRGWKSIDKIMDEEWPAAEKDFQRILGEAD